jgi:hypothetical protein
MNSNEIVLFSSGALARDARRTTVAVNRVYSRGEIRQAEVDVESDVAQAKLDAVTRLTGQAMTAVARLAQAETALTQNFPAASGRLAFIAEQHMLLSGDIVADLHYRVRRK